MKNQLDDITIEDIRGQAMLMATHVRKAVTMASSAFLSLNSELAHAVIGEDKVINSYEIDIEKKIYQFFALNQPKNEVLRLLLAIQKINVHLERIGDHAVNIAESAVGLGPLMHNRTFLTLPEMADIVKQMLFDAVDCFGNNNEGLAHDVLQRDDQVDRLNADMVSNVKELVMSGAETFEAAMELIRVSKNFERIADLSTNVAEEVIFFLQGITVKHHASGLIPVVDL